MEGQNRIHNFVDERGQSDRTVSITDYQAIYLANLLTRRLPANDIDKLTASLQDAQVDLTPHQVEAALFAFKSPLSKGAILADEVGLGKTIEAGIILSQHWSEHKRRLLVICPANLRKRLTFTRKMWLLRQSNMVIIRSCIILLIRRSWWEIIT